VQTHNGGATPGKAEHYDSITFTFAGPVTPSLVLAGWDGSAVAVSVHLQHNSSNDILSVRNASTGTTLAELGAVELRGNYTTGNSDFAGSQMTMSGNTITVVLGNGVGNLRTNVTKAAVFWSTPKGSATESGALDVDF